MIRSFRTLFRILTFRITAEEIDALGWRDLLLGLACTWVVGIGRWWDDPRAPAWSRLGLGSLLYVIVLAIVLRLALLPLRVRNDRYFTVLTYVTLTAPPAILYAIPVERWMSMQAAQAVNAWFLAVVAAWRVAAWLIYCRRGGGLPWWLAVAASLLPLALAVMGLARLDLSSDMFELMAGFREPHHRQDAATMSVILLGFGATALSPFLLLLYLAGWWWRRRANRTNSA